MTKTATPETPQPRLSLKSLSDSLAVLKHDELARYREIQMKAQNVSNDVKRLTSELSSSHQSLTLWIESELKPLKNLKGNMKRLEENSKGRDEYICKSTEELQLAVDHAKNNMKVHLQGHKKSQDGLNSSFLDIRKELGRHSRDITDLQNSEADPIPALDVLSKRLTELRSDITLEHASLQIKIEDLASKQSKTNLFLITVVSLLTLIIAIQDIFF